MDGARDLLSNDIHRSNSFALPAYGAVVLKTP
jgi:hypothetical protein